MPLRPNTFPYGRKGIHKVGITTTATVAASSNGLLTNLLAYWPLDEASGTRADSHTNGYDMDTIVNAPGNISAKNGNGLNCVRASAQYIESTASGLLTALTSINNYTINFWANADTGATIWYYNCDNVGKMRWSTSPDLKVHRGSEGWMVGPNITDETTYMYTITYDGTQAEADRMDLYLDGSLQSTTLFASMNTPTGTPTYFRIGSDGSAHFDGWLDEFAVWTRTLSSDDITTLYNGGTGTFYDDFTS